MNRERDPHPLVHSGRAAGWRALATFLTLLALLIAAVASAQSPLTVHDQALPSATPLSEVLADEIEVPVLEPTRAVIQLHTTVPLACVVAYGIDASFGRLAQDPMMGAVAMRDHEVVLDDLEPDTVYLLRFQGSDASGTFYASPTYRLRTPARSAGSADPADTAREPREPREIAAAAGLAPALSGLTVRAVSSEFGGGFLAEAALNDMPGEWSSSGDGDDAFLEVALPQRTRLAGATVHTRTMTDSARIERFQLVTDDGTVLGPFTLPDAERPYAFPFAAPMEAVTVRFEVLASTGGNTGLVRFDLHPAD